MYTLKEKPKKLSLASKKKLVTACCQIWEAENPEPKCELYYKSAYQLLVSVVLSAQTTDKMVNRCMKEVYDNGFNIQKALDLGESGLLAIIKSIGLANTKAKNVFKLSHNLQKKHSSKVPNNFEDLVALPGVGRKTANVILAELFGEKTLAVDTHVFRVSYRLGLHTEKTADKAEQTLLKLIPSEYLPRIHHWFILHGRYICKAQKPNCSACTIADLCPIVKKTN